MINIHSVNGYMTLRSWQLGNILQLATQGFCHRFVDYKEDPCGRLRDQMEMAARTVPISLKVPRATKRVMRQKCDY